MSLGLLFGIGAIAAATSDSRKQREEVRKQIRLHGANAVSIDNIAKAAGVSKMHLAIDEFNKTDARMMINFINENTNKQGLKEFERRLNDKMNEQQKNKKMKMKNRYSSYKKFSDKCIQSGFSNYKAIIEINRPYSIQPKIHKQMMTDLHNKTWWGKAIITEKINDSSNELYEIRVPNNIFKDFRMDKSNLREGRMMRYLKKQYNNCLKYCGYDPL